MDTDGWQPIDTAPPEARILLGRVEGGRTWPHLKAALWQANRIPMALHRCPHTLETSLFPSNNRTNADFLWVLVS